MKRIYSNALRISAVLTSDFWAWDDSKIGNKFMYLKHKKSLLDALSYLQGITGKILSFILLRFTTFKRKKILSKNYQRNIFL